MTRDAKLYFLQYKDYKPLIDLFENDKDHTLKDDLIIYQLMMVYSTGQYYALVSLSDEADKIVENYGATIAPETDDTGNKLHDYHGEPLYGDKTYIVFLQKT